MISNIYPHIFIGSKDAISPEILREYDINVVISALTEEEYSKFNITNDLFTNTKGIHVDWHRLVIDDYQEEDIDDHFEPISKIIEHNVNNKKNVLIHCAMGASRSATLAIAFIMLENNWRFEDTLSYVKEVRSIIDPNPGFQRRLYRLEEQIFDETQAA